MIHTNYNTGEPCFCDVGPETEGMGIELGEHCGHDCCGEPHNLLHSHFLNASDCLQCKRVQAESEEAEDMSNLEAYDGLYLDLCALLRRVEMTLGFHSKLYQTLNEARMQAVSDAPAGWGGNRRTLECHFLKSSKEKQGEK